ncbi:hypothetical protein HII31_04037, partial [Pseudocercospora fuligena]
IEGTRLARHINTASSGLQNFADFSNQGNYTKIWETPHLQTPRQSKHNTMAPTALLYKRDTSDNFETYRIIILVFAIIVLITSICSSIFVYRARTRMVERRKAMGCHCYDDLSVCWTPWWYWALARCTCDPSKMNGNAVPLATYQRTMPPSYQQSQEQQQGYRPVPLKHNEVRPHEQF